MVKEQKNKRGTWPFGPAVNLAVKDHFGEEGHQSRLAEALEVKPSSVSQLLSGKNPMSEATLAKIAGVLGMTSAVLIARGMKLHERAQRKPALAKTKAPAKGKKRKPSAAPVGKLRATKAPAPAKTKAPRKTKAAA